MSHGGAGSQLGGNTGWEATFHLTPKSPEVETPAHGAPRTPGANNENDLGSAECSLSVSTRSARDIPLCRASHNSVHVRKLRHGEGK